MTLDRVAIVSVPVTDQERSRQFYVDQLGFEIVRDNPMGPAQRWLQVRPSSGAETSLTLVTWLDSMSPGSMKGLVIETAEVDADHQRLTEAGVTVGSIEQAPWGRYFQLHDPDGNGLVVQQTREDT